MTSRIANRSAKRSKQGREYIKLRNQFLIDHPYCQVRGCGCPSSDVHHKAGRVGKLLTDVTKFLAVCRPHHIYIEKHPLESKKEGYSLSRLSK